MMFILCARIIHLSFCASLQSYCEDFNSLVDRIQWQAVPPISKKRCTLLSVQWLIRVVNGACDRLPTSSPRHGSPCVRQIWRQL